MCFVRGGTGGCPISELKLHKTPNSVTYYDHRCGSYQNENPKYTNAGIIALTLHKMMTMVILTTIQVVLRRHLKWKVKLSVKSSKTNGSKEIGKKWLLKKKRCHSKIVVDLYF